MSVFKILNGYENIDRNMFFSLKKDSRTRGHEVKLVKDQCRLDMYLGEHLPLYWENCTWESTYHCTGETVLGRAPTTVLGNMCLVEHLPLYWGTVLGLACTIVLGNHTWERTSHCTGKLYSGEHLPLYWGNCTWESTYHCTGKDEVDK